MKFLKSVLLFIFNFYKAIWIWFLALPRVGKVLVSSFLIFAFAISSLANSGQNGQVKGVNYTKKANSSTVNSSQNFSSSNSIFSSSFSSSSENLANNNEIFSENLAKSTENSEKPRDTAEVSKPQIIETSQETAENQKNSANLVVESPKTDKKLYQVLEIVDGDTIKVNEIGTLRLIGIDTPETKDPRKVVQCFGKEASNNAKNLLSGQKVYLEFDKSKPILDKYQRTLAYVFREDGYFYNLETVKDGFAHSYREYPHPKLDEFNSAENSARNDKKGFWADNTCQGNTEQVAGGEVAKVAVPPTGGTQEETQTPKAEIQVEKPAVGNFDSNNDGKVTCKDFKGQVTDPNILAQYPKLDGNSDGIGCESN